MKSFNLSEWALRHRTLVTFFMLVIVVAGSWSYFRLGRSEDPDFTVKTMVVQAAWPGATVGDTLEQITDRIESKLQETPSLDYLKSYTIAGQTTIFVYLKDSTPPTQAPGISILLARLWTGQTCTGKLIPASPKPAEPEPNRQIWSHRTLGRAGNFG